MIRPLWTNWPDWNQPPYDTARYYGRLLRIIKKYEKQPAVLDIPPMRQLIHFSETATEFKIPVYLLQGEEDILTFACHFVRIVKK